MGDVGAEREGSKLASEGYFFENQVVVFVLLIFKVDGDKVVEL